MDQGEPPPLQASQSAWCQEHLVLTSEAAAKAGIHFTVLMFHVEQ